MGYGDPASQAASKGSYYRNQIKKTAMDKLNEEFLQESEGASPEKKKILARKFSAYADGLETYINGDFQKKVRAASLVQKKGLESLMGKEALEKMANGIVAKNPVEGAFMQIGAAMQGALNAFGVSVLKSIDLWKSTFSQGMQGFAININQTVSSFIGTFSPMAGKILGGFGDMLISSAFKMFDWGIYQNQLNIKTQGLTGRSGAVQYGNFMGMNTADASKWANAALAGGATGTERTGMMFKRTGTELDQKRLNAAAHKIGDQINGTNISVKDILFDADKLKQSGQNAGKNLAKNIVEVTRHGVHEANIAESLFGLGTQMGMDAGATGQMFHEMKQATGDAVDSIHAMEQVYGTTQAAARRTGIATDVLRTAIMGVASSARMLNVDMKSVNDTMTVLAKNRNNMGALGIDLDKQGGDIMKGLIDRSSMNEAQHANLGMQMAQGLGMNLNNPLQGWLLSKYGSNVAKNLTFTGNDMTVAGSDNKKAFANLSGDVNAESLKAMRAEAYSKTSNITDAATRMLTMQKILEAEYNVKGPAADVLLSTKEEDINGLSDNKEFQNIMKDPAALAAQTLTIEQRQEQIQRHLVAIAINIASVATAGFATLARHAIKTIFGIDKLATPFGGILTKSDKEMLMTGLKKTEGIDLGETTAQAITNVANEVYALSKEAKAQGSPMLNAIQSGVVIDAKRKRIEQEENKHIAYDARIHYNPLTNADSYKSAVAVPVTSGVTRHSGGPFMGTAKVLDDEIFSFKSFHSGGTYGGVDDLKNNEAYMISKSPMQVHTRGQYSDMNKESYSTQKQSTSNGNVYHITIQGVASKSDIINTMQKAMNEVMG